MNTYKVIDRLKYKHKVQADHIERINDGTVVFIDENPRQWAIVATFFQPIAVTLNRTAPAELEGE